MKKSLQQLTALLMCLYLLLPQLALADSQANAVAFTLEAEMFPEAYPQQDQSLMQSLSQLVNILTLEGTFQYNEDCMDLDMEALLDHDESTRTGVQIYGYESRWSVRSSLFGEEELTLSLQALLEFCMKAYFHLEVPLQRVGLLVTPYVHKDGLGTLSALWNQVMHAESGTRTIARDDVLDLAQRISDAAPSDRAFTYWVQAVALEAGYDGVINDFVSLLPEWADEFLDDSGLTITVDDAGEIWATGSATLFSRTEKDGWTTLSLSLPMTTDGYILSAFCTLKDNGANLDADIRLSVTQEGENILDLRLSADNLPQVIPANGDFTLSYDATGDAVPGGFHLLFEGSNTDGAFTLHQKDAATGETMLTLTGSAVPTAVTSPLNWTYADLNGLEFFSVNDITLSQFISDVKQPLITGVLALLKRAPMAACQSLMDLVTDTGIFDLLTSSASDVEDIDEASWDDEEWYEESWDEESWEDDSWADENWDDVDWDDESLYE